MNILRKAIGGKFIRNVSIIMSGSIFAQLLTLLTAPLLSRLFSPSDFGVFAFYTSIVSILAVIITFRYELSIVIPKKDEDSISLLYISIAFSTINSIILFIVLFFTKDIIAAYSNVNEFTSLYYFIPFILFFIGVFNSLKYWNIRKEKFIRTSLSNVTNSMTTNITQIGFGLLSFSFYGLVMGKLLGQFLAFIIMLIQVLKEDFKKLKNSFNLFTIIKNLKEYKEFPLYGSPQALFTSLSVNMVPILMMIFFNANVVGFYALALRVLQMPINLIGNAFKDVFYQRVASLINQKGDIKKLYYKSMLLLLILFLPFVLLIVLFSNELFIIAFGDEWHLAGDIAKWMILWLYFLIISRPSIVLMQVLKKQKEYLKLEVIGFLIKTMLFVLSSIVFNDYIVSIAVYSLANIVHYLVIMLLVNKYLRKYSSLSSTI